MRPTSRLAAALIAVLLLATLGACKSTKVPPPTAPTPTATTPGTGEGPEGIEEEIVGEPTAEPLVSEEVREELPEDLALLNAGGYLEDIFFDTNLYDIKPEYRDALARNAAWLQQHRTIQILIEGHCDERNTREYNLALGERRAAAVRDYLIFLGVGAERLRTISYGEERPFEVGSGEQAWRLNRRAHFVITAR
ncbi:MAG TPA: peptidoglycan-associated lipoprotein Pal [Thermoanaerobaculales bacterium]|nr:peptidoglycan-associated lipoprotein Pal [Thermoanaerobaculales bacterium]HPA81350.1 peptidoglycan-associated lipoprotein Pal [Thermoanaerobaculales bacterium]HQL29373.1 peptidoglycan-associated lipoprotein Pal [Thermoanaerobaculales bacterium]HQN96055.1 peptidoglycan-associated lipoprotein Pal [Thermoanaerobaculales bacterium]HQP44704.1 peptidoglycan-associated lipoprotein Pal [Thermoanaerobaculales bacterium]